MRAAVRSLICIALVAVLLTLPQTRQANAESNSAVASNGSALTAPSGNEPNRPAESGEPAYHKGSHAQPKKKKTSFVNKMRDKAMAKMQKFFGKKQELQPSAKQIPKQDVE